MPKGRIFAVHQALTHYCSDVFVHPAAPKFVAQGLLEHIADGTLSIRAAVIQRYFVQFICSQLGAPQNEANLRPISMRNDYIPAFGNHVGDITHRFARRRVLIGNALPALVLDEGVATNGNDGNSLSHRGWVSAW